MKPNTRNQISWHFKDLLKRDINVAYDCTLWLQPNQRDIDRRARPKRLASRYMAACMVVEGAENPAFAKEVLDRTEGKVADRLQIDQQHSIHVLIDLSAGLLAPDNPVTQAQQVIEGTAVSEHALDRPSSASVVEGQGQATPSTLRLLGEAGVE